MRVAALKDRQFRLFFSGVFFSVQAIWMQRVTIAWVAWEMSGSAAFVGLVASLTLLPSLVSGPLFGVLADRVDIRRAAFVTNAAMAAILVCLAVALPSIGPVGLSVAAMAIGVTSSAGHPVRMSLGPRLVAPELVSDVVAMTALLFNVARLVSPVLTGMLIVGAGPRATLALAAILYAPILLALIPLRPRALPERAPQGFLSALWSGMRHVIEAPVIRLAFALSLILATVIRGALELLPVLADGAFERGAAGLGLLTAAAGAGALVSAVLKALGVGDHGPRIPAGIFAVIALGLASVAAMGLSPSWPLALLATSVAGGAATYVAVTLQATIQTDLADDLRGRVMSLWTVVGFGTVAVGAFLIGALGEIAGIRIALMIGGAIGIACLAALGARTYVRNEPALRRP